MAFFQTAIGHLNRMFGDTEFLREHREALLPLYSPSADPGQAAADVMRSTEHMLSEHSPLGESIQGIDPGRIARILQQQPATIIEAQRAVVHRNLQREEPYGMTFAWAPAYDYEVNVWESPPTDATPGWITVLIKSRYPRDPHPITATAMEGGERT
jgi:hypothetical protein